jgi:hypothetical protein
MHRAWGWIAFAIGVAIAAEAVLTWAELGGRDRLVIGAAVAVLVADGMLNLFPSWFGHFKERMQVAWVRRHGTSAKASDRELFGTVNVFLGLAAAAVGVVAYAHRPFGKMWLAGSLVAALVLTFALIAGCEAEARRRGSAG